MVALLFMGRVARGGEAELPRTETETTSVRTAVANGLPNMDLNAQRRAKNVAYVSVQGILHECAKMPSKM